MTMMIETARFAAKILTAAILLAAGLSAQTGQEPVGVSTSGGSPPYVKFGGANPFALGYNPAVAVCGSMVVEVHNGGAGAGLLYARAGTVSRAAITWGSNNEYDYGSNPSIACVGSTVVEVHNGGFGAGPLWYRVGTVSGSNITWGNSAQYDSYGFNPVVAVSGSIVVEAHNGGVNPGPMWSRTGFLNGQTINWDNNSISYDSGYNPSLAISGTTVLEVHNGTAGVGTLWYHAGQVMQLIRTVAWAQNGYPYDYGMNPKVGVANLGSGSPLYAYEVHDGSAVDTLWSDAGFFTGPSSIAWIGPYNYGVGFNPSVAGSVVGYAEVPSSYCCGFYAVEVHNGQLNPGLLWGSVGGILPSF